MGNQTLDASIQLYGYIDVYVGKGVGGNVSLSKTRLPFARNDFYEPRVNRGKGVLCMGIWIPRLVLQLMGNKVVSIGTTIDNGNGGV